MSLVSIIIPTFNRGNAIHNAIQSIIHQTYEDVEIIIVDDGSTDDTKTVVAAFSQKDQRIHYVQSTTNRGAQAARNMGIRAARGEWIAFLDSDDRWLPNSLQKRLEVALKAGVNVVHSECWVLRNHEEKEYFGIPPLEGNIYRELLQQPGPLFPSLLIAKKALQQIGDLDEHLLAYQEWDTAIRLAKREAFCFVPLPTFIYDCRGKDRISANALRDARGYQQVVRKYRLPILYHAGLLALAEHYQTTSTLFYAAGEVTLAQSEMKRASLYRTLKQLLSKLPVLSHVKH
ncbi:glycosyl transferase, family 2 [Candidatus Vecturithrix granuli]|uniref:Glycosyl transferase, family 2 n=1 Tax=Vecturithrix granuli TaxID=1499967 RepID=A0A0S6W9Z3_VECG1|nr:glycosyl transferase, family 2 [Candidatus Vecturithrix granuli]